MNLQNKIRKLRDRQSPVIGTYASVYSLESIQALAEAGLDFVRVDLPLRDISLALAPWVDAVTQAGLPVWLRCSADPVTIQLAASTAAQAITITKVDSAVTARSIVEMIRHAWRAPHTDNKNQSIDRGQPFISLQIETMEGVEAAPQIMTIDGVDCVQSGRMDLAQSLNLPGQSDHPLVRENEHRVIALALAAKKDVSIHELMTDEGLAKIQEWRDFGVRLFTLDIDRRVLSRTYRMAVSHLRQG